MPESCKNKEKGLYIDNTRTNNINRKTNIAPQEMNELSIKIKIADRDYPMRVSPEEEERLRVAGKFLNERLKLFKEQFGITDKQDLLAMVALETAADRLKTVQAVTQSDTTFSDKLTRLNDTLNALELD